MKKLLLAAALLLGTCALAAHHTPAVAQGAGGGGAGGGGAGAGAGGAGAGSDVSTPPGSQPNAQKKVGKKKKKKM